MPFGQPDQQDPQMQALMQEMMRQQGGMQGAGRMAGPPQRPQGIEARMNQPSNNLSNLADAFPKLKAQEEQMKIDDAKRKAKQLEFKRLLAKAEEQFNLRQQQQQIQAAQNSV